jgi:NAD(P)-dependent dehydrogenase (short-subunit alcohol dehydrogenase family)
MALPPGLTADGYEIQSGTNILSHALLIKLLLPLMLTTAKQPSADVRIVLLTSEGYAFHPSGGIVFRDLKTSQSGIGLLGPWQRYGQSKLASYAALRARTRDAVRRAGGFGGKCAPGCVQDRVGKRFGVGTAGVYRGYECRQVWG